MILSWLKPFNYHGLYKNRSAMWEFMSQHWANIRTTLHKRLSWWESILTQQTRRLDPMLFQCWSSAVGGGPILKQHWVKCSRLLETHTRRWTNVGLMLAHRLRRWPHSTIPTLVQHGHLVSQIMLIMLNLTEDNIIILVCWASFNCYCFYL